MSRFRQPEIRLEMQQLREAIPSGPYRAYEQEVLRYWSEDHARDGRGLTRSSLRLIVKTTKHVRRMARHADEHHDPNVRRAARKFVKRLGHADQKFSEIASRAKDLRGDVQRAGRRKADDQRMEQEAKVVLSRRFSLREVKSRKSIKAYGRSLNLCTSSDKWTRHYYQEITDLNARLWCLFKDGEPYGFIKTHAGIVEECSRGKKHTVADIFDSNRRLNVPHRVALNILRAIDANGDDDESFARSGAFRVFLECAPRATTIRVGKYRYWIWVTNDGREIVIARRERPRKRLRWSHFRRSRKGRLTGGTHNAVSTEDLAGLMLDHPSLISAIAPPETTAPCG
jgi:hypothetical protein